MLSMLPVLPSASADFLRCPVRCMIQLRVRGKEGAEEVIVCQGVYTSRKAIWDAYTITEFDWMVLEVNTMWRRNYRVSSGDGGRSRVPFYCRYCETNMADKSVLGLHLQKGLCENYNPKVSGQLKMFPMTKEQGNNSIRAVFERYRIELPWQCGGTGGKPDESDDEDDPPRAARGKSVRGQQPPQKRIRVSIDLSGSDDDFDMSLSTKKSKGRSDDGGQGARDDVGVESKPVQKPLPPAKKAAPPSSSKSKSNVTGQASGSTPGLSRTASATPPKVKSSGRPGHAHSGGPPRCSSQGYPSDMHRRGMAAPSVETRDDVAAAAAVEAKRRFPELDPKSCPKKPTKTSGLYALIELTEEIISVETQTDVTKAMDALRTLHCDGVLRSKVFGAWSALTCNHAIAVRDLLLLFSYSFFFFPLQFVFSLILILFLHVHSSFSFQCPRYLLPWIQNAVRQVYGTLNTVGLSSGSGYH